MVNNVKPGYINPLTMMKGNKQARNLNSGTMKTKEKKQKALEAEKQSIQNSLLLMKGTSGNGDTSGENIELLEKKLEEITNEIKANKQESVESLTDKERQVEESGKSIVSNNFDIYRKEEHEKSAGCYRIVNDDNKGYKIEYDGIIENS